MHFTFWHRPEHIIRLIDEDYFFYHVLDINSLYFCTNSCLALVRPFESSEVELLHLVQRVTHPFHFFLI